MAAWSVTCSSRTASATLKPGGAGEGDPQLRPSRGRGPRRAGSAVSSISRFLDPQQAIAAAHAGEIEVLDSRRFGGAWVLDQLWDRLGIGAALRLVGGRRIDGGAAERRCSRWWRSGTGAGQRAGRHTVGGRAGRDRRLPRIQRRLRLRGNGFPVGRVGRDRGADLRLDGAPADLDVGIVFVDTTSTYWKVDGADEWAELQPDRRPTTGRARRSRAGSVGSASPRTTATTCLRW